MCNNNCLNCNCSTNCGEYSDFGIVGVGSQVSTSTGDSRAIRIGNDIKLDVTIQELNGMDIINIKSIKCFIINTTPMLQDHCGTQYEIRRCGLPGYYAHPVQEYHGFGVYPGFPKTWHHNLYPYYGQFGHHYLKPINKHHNHCEFIAPVKALEERNKVRVFFPATAQMLCGLYSLTFVIDLYEPGYHSNNLRTITVDYNNIFELVPNAEGKSGDITIDIDKQIGINVYDNTMFGNTTQNNQQQEQQEAQPKIESITITGDDDIRVGQFKTYTATSVPDSSSIEWYIIGNKTVAEMNNAGDKKVVVFAKKIANAAEGKDVITLQCRSTDGGGVVGEKNITIHNYATDIVFRGNTSVPYGESVTGQFYIMQEDDTKLANCEQKCPCQALDIREINIVEGSEHGIGCFVKDENGCDVYKVTNINHASNTHTFKIEIVGNARTSNGEYVKSYVTFNMYGTDSTNDPSVRPSGDIYIDGGNYNDGHITLNYKDNLRLPLDINVSALQNGTDEYWYNETSN